MVKICGVRDEAGVDACVAAGADFVGFTFAPASRRRVELERALELRERLVGVATRVVAVFADQPAAFVMRIARTLRVDAVQLHGAESAAYCDAIGGPFEVWRGVSVIDLSEELAGAVDRVVLDGRTPGSGVTWDWSGAPAALRSAGLDAERVLVAGGLDASRVGAALAATGAAGVDVASGIETNGAQDPAKIAALIAAVRAFGGGVK